MHDEPVFPRPFSPPQARSTYTSPTVPTSSSPFQHPTHIPSTYPFQYFRLMAQLVKELSSLRYDRSLAPTSSSSPSSAPASPSTASSHRQHLPRHTPTSTRNSTTPRRTAHRRSLGTHPCWPADRSGTRRSRPGPAGSRRCGRCTAPCTGHKSGSGAARS